MKRAKSVKENQKDKSDVLTLGATTTEAVAF